MSFWSTSPGLCLRWLLSTITGPVLLLHRGILTWHTQKAGKSTRVPEATSPRLSWIPFPVSTESWFAHGAFLACPRRWRRNGVFPGPHLQKRPPPKVRLQPPSLLERSPPYPAYSGISISTHEFGGHQHSVHSQPSR